MKYTQPLVVGLVVLHIPQLGVNDIHIIHVLYALTTNRGSDIHYTVMWHTHGSHMLSLVYYYTIMLTSLHTLISGDHTQELLLASNMLPRAGISITL